MNRLTLLRLSIALSALLLPVAANAGEKVTDYVYVSTSSSSEYAQGTLGDARNSSDGTEYIGCDTSTGYGYTELRCIAVNSAGNAFYCTTTDPNMIKLATTITSMSFLELSGDGNSNCTSISVLNLSLYKPPTP